MDTIISLALLALSSYHLTPLLQKGTLNVFLRIDTFLSLEEIGAASDLTETTPVFLVSSINPLEPCL